jgi:hypothetical protein
VPVRLPVTILVLVRDAMPPLAAFLSEARALREHLGRDAALLPPPSPLRRRAQILPLLVLPATAFDTPGFPGADPAQRRAAAGEFLAREAIGLALSPP